MKFRKSEDERTAARERRLRRREQAEERRRAQRAQRDAIWREQAERRAATTALPYLGVAVRDGVVVACTLAVVTGRSEGPRLGDLAGAHAEVTGGKGGSHRESTVRAGDALVATPVLGPAAVSRKGFVGTAFVIFTNGTLHEHQLADQTAFVKAQADAVRFNALAAAAPNRDLG